MARNIYCLVVLLRSVTALWRGIFIVILFYVCCFRFVSQEIPLYGDGCFLQSWLCYSCVFSIPLSKAIPVRKLWKFRVCSQERLLSCRFCWCYSFLFCKRNVTAFYYSTAFSRVQITPKTSTNIPRYLYSRRPVWQVFYKCHVRH